MEEEEGEEGKSSSNLPTASLSSLELLPQTLNVHHCRATRTLRDYPFDPCFQEGPMDLADPIDPLVPEVLENLFLPVDLLLQVLPFYQADLYMEN